MVITERPMYMNICDTYAIIHIYKHIFRPTLTYTQAVLTKVVKSLALRNGKMRCLFACGGEQLNVKNVGRCNGDVHWRHISYIPCVPPNIVDNGSQRSHQHVECGHADEQHFALPPAEPEHSSLIGCFTARYRSSVMFKKLPQLIYVNCTEPREY